MRFTPQDKIPDNAERLVSLCLLGQRQEWLKAIYQLTNVLLESVTHNMKLWATC